ncbi:dienelactone hydrolase family protein [Jiella sp. MQZ9-1]|uniref:Dienelactone hydrolase family protein n=1 Tax=Jiella flava TaxID=2816857 RepID=A0A939FUY7_9HYPH|nr:dienelactone hydrolase family protein [Jiella flava]MBO0661920.1 dienelactone hydrolase family protein [Jiella flava]MCD2470752.1 dienelactone hydrolase family protein [Jiella flava]
MAAIDRNGPLAASGLLTAGCDPKDARLALVLMHGRGASAADIIGLVAALGLPDLFAVAPDAPGGAWYPAPFMQPLANNEPYLTNALARITAIFEGLDAIGFGPERRVLGGFSQGACLSLEYCARNPGGIAGVLGFSGGLIGPDATGRSEVASLAGTTVFMGCSRSDPFIPAARVMETERHLRARGASVETVLYPEPGHGINADEIARAKRLLQSIG